MATFYKKGKTFAVSYKLKGTPRQYIYGLKSKQLAVQVKQQKALEEQMCRAGLLKTDPKLRLMEEAADAPLSQHIEEFERDIVSRGKSKQHSGQQAAHVTRLLKMSRIRSINDLALQPVQKALKDLLGSNCGARTCNAARQAVIQFERFCRRCGKIRDCVMHDLQRFNEAEDVRRARRALSQEEVDWLLKITAASRDATSRRCGISGADRSMLYATAIATGLRQRTLLSLTKPSFFLDRHLEAPFVRVAAQFNKNRRSRDQKIPRSFADVLAKWVGEKHGTGPVWQPAPHASLALRFRRDLETARVAWISAGSDSDECTRRENSGTLKYATFQGAHNVYADFHSLRHTGITFIVRKAGIWIGQVWADHSTPALTARYAHVTADDLRGALDGLPELCASTGRSRDSNATVK